jgi:hypothetical protein
VASHVSLVIGNHFCEGNIVESKILMGEIHLGCNMPDMLETCTHSENQKNNESYDAPCCENEYQTVQTTSEYVKDAAQIMLNGGFALAAFYTTLYLDLFPKADYQSEILFIPPPIEEDIQALFQTFLI